MCEEVGISESVGYTALVQQNIQLTQDDTEENSKVRFSWFCFTLLMLGAMKLLILYIYYILLKILIR